MLIVTVQPGCEAVLAELYKRLPWYWDVWTDIEGSLTLESCYKGEKRENEHHSIIKSHMPPKYGKVLTKIFYIRNETVVQVHGVRVRHAGKQYP